MFVLDSSTCLSLADQTESERVRAGSQRDGERGTSRSVMCNFGAHGQPFTIVTVK